MLPAWPIPYVPDPAHFALDAFVSFCVSVLLAVLVNAEAQAFASTLLGDHRVGAKDRFHFIAFFHLDILGSINYLAGGFGWAKHMDVNPAKFKHPFLYTLLSRLAGPFANILLANIAASLIFLMRAFEYDPRVFSMVVGVNLTTAVYHLLPLPPLAVGTALVESLPPGRSQEKRLLMLAGPFLVLALTLADRLSDWGLVRPYLDPLVLWLLRVVIGGQP
ncbi:MAG: hypothetical protein FJ128_05730 [Deltaproteobacteria bacterium]|nr:hypothetical protein [Deltaproteobacteria bacterium]